jgi:hypothetical protein
MHLPKMNGQAVWFLGTLAIIKASAESTRGAFGLIDSVTVLATAECAARALDELTGGELGLPRPGGIYDPWRTVAEARKWWDETGKRRYPQND